MKKEDSWEKAEGYQEEVERVDEILDSGEEVIRGAHCLNHFVARRWYNERLKLSD